MHPNYCNSVKTPHSVQRERFPQTLVSATKIPCVKAVNSDNAVIFLVAHTQTLHPATPIIPKTYEISRSGTLGVRFNAFPMSHRTDTGTSISGLIYCANSLPPPPPPGTPPDFIRMYNTLFYAALRPPVPLPGQDIGTCGH